MRSTVQSSLDHRRARSARPRRNQTSQHHQSSRYLQLLLREPHPVCLISIGSQGIVSGAHQLDDILQCLTLSLQKPQNAAKSHFLAK